MPPKNKGATHQPQHTEQGTTNNVMSKHKQTRPPIAWQYWRVYLIRIMALALINMINKTKSQAKQHKNKQHKNKTKKQTKK